MPYRCVSSLYAEGHDYANIEHFRKVHPSCPKLEALGTNWVDPNGRIILQYIDTDAGLQLRHEEIDFTIDRGVDSRFQVHVFAKGVLIGYSTKREPKDILSFLHGYGVGDEMVKAAGDWIEDAVRQTEARKAR